MAKPPKISVVIRRTKGEHLAHVGILRRYNNYFNVPLCGTLTEDDALELAKILGVEVEYDDYNYPAQDPEPEEEKPAGKPSLFS